MNGLTHVSQPAGTGHVLPVATRRDIISVPLFSTFLNHVTLRFITAMTANSTNHKIHDKAARCTGFLGKSGIDLTNLVHKFFRIQTV